MLKIICNILSSILIFLLAVMAGVMILPTILGYKSLAVLSGSMEPVYPVGCIVYAKEVDPNQLQVGDVISYSIGQETLVTHRMHEIMAGEGYLITKGDANDSADINPVLFSAVMGKVNFHLPYLGYVSIYAKTPLGIIVVCGILIIMILLIFIPEIFSSDDEKEERKKSARKIE